AEAPVHTAAPLGRAGPAGRARYLRRRRRGRAAEGDRPAARLPLPRPLPLRDRRVRDRDPAAARDRVAPPRRVPCGGTRRGGVSRNRLGGFGRRALVAGACWSFRGKDAGSVRTWKVRARPRTQRRGVQRFPAAQRVFAERSHHLEYFAYGPVQTWFFLRKPSSKSSL